ncbi:MAG: hypothetical protein JXM74_08380 [Fusobacteriaceae bacterium]|nr:hypothetical protein [Fusobacteriaceae bacterium]MBN2838753.1 hypothetical protein [Fusobacteriaceae bacterium]
MKKFKKYIVLLFLPIVLLGCVQKGVSDSTSGDTNSNLGGYTWAQLQNMIELSDESGNSPTSIIGNMKSISGLSSSSYVDSTDKVNIQNLLSIMTENYESIKDQNDDFVYSTALTKLNEADTTFINSSKVISLNNLKRLKTELTPLLSLNDSTINTIYNKVNLATTNLPIYKNNNPFYALSSDLFYLYHNYLEPNNTLLNSNGISLTNIDRTAEIKNALTTITLEISKLDSNSMEFTGKSELRSYLVTLQSMYNKYLNYTSTYTDIKGERLDLRTYESQEFSNSVSQLAVYDYWINDVYSKLENKTATDYNNDANLISLKNSYKNYIYNNYKTYITSYSTTYLNQEYSVINSKAVIVLETIAYLKKNQLILSNTLDIDLLWTM